MSRGKADSGWAWMIVLAVTIVHISILPMQQCFGLIFAERFALLGITATQTSFILHLNGTITCGLGIINGPMLKRFSFRKVAFFGGLTIAIGICMTAFAVTVPFIIVTYCVIIGIGYGIAFPATSLALNTYFRKKRNMAMGFSVTLTGLGPILMPLLLAELLETYGTTGTLLILGGIAMHSFIGATLLKPFMEKKMTSVTKSNDITPSSLESAADNHVGEGRLIEREVDTDTDTAGSQLFSDPADKDNVEFEQRLQNIGDVDVEKDENSMILRKIAKNLDLDLLRDKRFVAVVLGMGVSLVAETNFNAMFPFVLIELAGLDRTSIATVMSIQAAFDISGRLCVPLIAQRAGWTSRNIYVISLIGSTLGRTILSTWGNTYAIIISVAVIVGISKGTKAVFQALIIPDYVPLERLPAASGIQMVFNGILSITMGPIIGLVHDFMESYVGALHFTSILSLSCVLLWFLGGLWTFGCKPVGSETRRKTAEPQGDTLEFQ